MVRHGNNIIIVKRDLKKWYYQMLDVISLARYRDTNQNTLPTNVGICRTYSGRPAQGRRARIRKRAKAAHQIRGRGFKNFAKKAFANICWNSSKKFYC